MPNQHAKDSVRLFIRLPAQLKERLEKVVQVLNLHNPGANYSLNSIVNAAIVRTVELVEGEEESGNN